MERNIRQVLAELELISHGTTASWNPAGGTDSDRDPRPRGGELDPPHDRYRRRYLNATTDTERANVLHAARAELAAITRRQAREVREETAAEFDARAREKLAEGWTVQQVADHMRATPTRIRRAQAGASEADVLAFAKQGMSVRYIALRVGIPKSTVQRLLRDLRNAA